MPGNSDKTLAISMLDASEMGEPGSPSSTRIFPWPPRTLASHTGISWLTLAQLVLSFQGHGAVTTWLKLTTTIPAAQAASMVGSSADVDAAWTMMASGLAAMMLLRELICASAEFSTVS